MKPVSVSDLSYFAGCRRAWYWGKQYYPLIPPDYFWVGTGVHAGLDNYFNSNRSLPKALTAVNEWYHNSIKELEGSVDSDVWVSEYRDRFQTDYELILGMVENFTIYDRIAHPPLFQGDVVATEVFASFKLSNGIVLRGRIDLVLENDLGLVLIDHKTFSSTPSQVSVDIDGQLTAYSYLWCMTRKRRPDVVAYNVLFKGMPQPPTRLKRGGLSKAKGQYTTEALYRESLLEEELDPADYEEILGILHENGWRQFFDEFITFRDPVELENFEKRVLQESQEINDVHADPEKLAYPAPSIYTCGRCDYKRACREKEQGGDYEWVLDQEFTTKSSY